MLLLLILLPLFIKEMRLLSERVPDFLVQLNQHLLPWIRTGSASSCSWTQRVEEPGPAKACRRRRPGDQTARLAQDRRPRRARILVDLVLVPVVLFYLLRDWNLLLAHIEGCCRGAGTCS